MKLNRYGVAEKFFGLATVVNKNHAIAWNNKGWALNEQKKYEEGLICLDTSLRIDNKLMLAWNNKGWALNCLGRHQEGKACLEKSIELGSPYAYTWENLAASYTALKQYDLAEMSFQKAIDIQPNSPGLYVGLSFTLFRQNLFEAAKVQLKHAISLDKKSPSALQVLSLIESSLKNFEGSEEILHTAFEIAKDDVTRGNILYSLSINALDLKKYSESEDYLDRVFLLTSNQISYKIAKAQIFHQSERNEQAHELLMNVLSAQPENKTAWNNLGCVFNDLRQYEKGIEAVNKGIELDTTFENPWNVKAKLEFSQKNYAAALVSVDKALELNPYYLKAAEFREKIVTKMDK